MERFFLGTHRDCWLSRVEFRDIPLFVSRRILGKRKSLPRAITDWSLDSGGFTELSMYGGWQTSAKQYVQEVARFKFDVGRLQWAAIQDWMCEPFILQKTGRTISEHQAATVQSWLDLNSMAPDLPWVAVIQGFELDDYRRCIDLYHDAGVAIETHHTVGIGSVCRRQGSKEIAEFVSALYNDGMRNLHGFGVKTAGLPDLAPLLRSADSMAWSFTARRRPVLLPACKEDGKHKNCANCDRWARRWFHELPI